MTGSITYGIKIMILGFVLTGIVVTTAWFTIFSGDGTEAQESKKLGFSFSTWLVVDDPNNVIINRVQASASNIKISHYYQYENDSSKRFVTDRINEAYPVFGFEPEDFPEFIHVGITIHNSKYRLVNATSDHEFNLTKIDLDGDGKPEPVLTMIAKPFSFNQKIILEPDPLYYTIKWILQDDLNCVPLITFADGQQTIFEEENLYGFDFRTKTENKKFYEEVCQNSN